MQYALHNFTFRELSPIWQVEIGLSACWVLSTQTVSMCCWMKLPGLHVGTKQPENCFCFERDRTENNQKMLLTIRIKRIECMHVYLSTVFLISTYINSISFLNVNQKAKPWNFWMEKYYQVFDTSPRKSNSRFQYDTL